MRRLDSERFELEIAGNDTRAGIPLLINNTGNAPKPTPFTTPRREGQRIDGDAAVQAPVPPGG